MTFHYRDYAAFRAEFVKLSAMNSYQRALYYAGKSHSARKSEPQWSVFYGKETAGRDWMDRPTEDEVCATLYGEYNDYRRDAIREQLRTGELVGLDEVIVAFDADVLLPIVRECLLEARQEANLARRMKVRGETLEWVETHVGQTQAVTVPLPT